MIRSSSIHAAGCYTTRPIKAGVRICEYDGPRMSKAEADARYEGRFVTYLFACGRNSVIDGFGTAMFFNHSCDPNCETEQEEDGRVFICAMRDIAAGEEHDSDEDNQDCYCGASECRNTMFSDTELKRRAKIARQKAAAGLGNPGL
jgi:SET domain-containing protein